MKEFAALQDMSQMPVMERLINALIVTVLGMGITFIVLIALMYTIKLMSAFFNKKTEPTPLVSAPAPVAVVPDKEVSDDEELVAILIAAVASASGQSYEKIKLRGYREVGIDLPLWSQAGVLETMNREI